MKTKLELTPAIHADNIQSRNYLGSIELPDGEMHIVRINTSHGDFLIAGGACNVGLLPEYARRLESWEDQNEALSEFVIDLEETTHPSGDLLSWHGSLVI